MIPKGTERYEIKLIMLDDILAPLITVYIEDPLFWDNALIVYSKLQRRYRINRHMFTFTLGNDNRIHK